MWFAAFSKAAQAQITLTTDAHPVVLKVIPSRLSRCKELKISRHFTHFLSCIHCSGALKNEFKPKFKYKRLH